MRLRRLSRRRDPDDLLRTELLVPIPDTGALEVGRRVLEEAEDVTFVIVEDPEGRLVLPAFTSERELQRWKPQGGPYIGLEGRVLIEFLAASECDRIVIDGAGAEPIGMTREAARELVGVTTHSFSPGSEYRIGLPAKGPPDRLIDELRETCARPEIAEAWLYQFQFVNGDDPPYLALGVLPAPGADEAGVEALLQAVGPQLRPARWGYEFIELHPLADDLLDAARANGIPIRP